MTVPVVVGVTDEDRVGDGDRLTDKLVEDVSDDECDGVAVNDCVTVTDALAVTD